MIFRKFKRKEKKQPLPVLKWADSEELWSTLVLKDEESISNRNPDVFEQHPNLQPRMRSVLLDWIIEVKIVELKQCFFN